MSYTEEHLLELWGLSNEELGNAAKALLIVWAQVAAAGAIDQEPESKLAGWPEEPAQGPLVDRVVKLLESQAAGGDDELTFWALNKMGVDPMEERWDPTTSAEHAAVRHVQLLCKHLALLVEAVAEHY